VVDWRVGVFASYSRGSNCPLARAMDGRICAAAQVDWLLPINYYFRDCKARLVMVTYCVSSAIFNMNNITFNISH